MKEKNYITSIGLERLQKELKNLVSVERVKTTKAIAIAAANGDRSENADYIYGRKRLREIDRRINFLSKRLKHIEVVHPEGMGNDIIQFGAYVTLENEVGEIKKVRIVGVDEVDLSKGNISWRSPIGKSLLGHRIDDEISVKTPKGLDNYMILEISYKRFDN